MAGSTMRSVLFGTLVAAPAIGASVLWSAAARPMIDPSTCTLRHAATTVASLRDLPRPISQDLQSRLRPFVELDAPAMADRGGAFRAADVVTDPAVPTRRFVHAGQSGNLWFVWYEQGGRGYTTHLVIYRIEAAARAAEPVMHLLMQPDHLCAATDAALDGRIDPKALLATEW